MCWSCSEPLPPRSRTGRPRVFCSTTCRRAHEYALRRRQALLLRAEKAEQDARLRQAAPRGTGAREAQEVAFWQAEVDRLREDLAEDLGLLSEDGPHDTDDPEGT